MTAPDPGLTDLIAAALYSVLAKSAKSGTATVDDLVASVIPVVEQHTNGRIAELEAQEAYWKWEADYYKNTVTPRWRSRAVKTEATVARVEKALAEGPLHRIDFPRAKDPYGIERQTIRAALEGES